MQDFSKEEIIRNIEQAHWVTTAGRRNPSATSAPPFLVAKITNWDMLEKINLPLLKLTRKVSQ